MSDVAKHYENLLARHYSWMVGAAFDAKVAEQQALLEELGAKGEGWPSIWAAVPAIRPWRWRGWAIHRSAPWMAARRC